MAKLVWKRFEQCQFILVLSVPAHIGSAADSNKVFQQLDYIKRYCMMNFLKRFLHKTCTKKFRCQDMVEISKLKVEQNLCKVHRVIDVMYICLP